MLSKHALDKRLHAFRDDLADCRLQELISNRRFVAGTLHHVITPVLNQYNQPALNSETVNQVLLGEEVWLFDRPDGFAWVQSCRTNYVGYVQRNGLAQGSAHTEYIVCQPSTLAFAEPNIKTPTPTVLPMLAEVSVSDRVGQFCATPQGWIFSAHLMPKNQPIQYDVTELIQLAKSYINTPYLWGGNTQAGLDCSGLVHLLWRRFGQALPRDSDHQEQAEHWRTTDSPEAGDLVFWPGHVGLMIDNTQLLHANAHALCTRVEPLKHAAQRIAESQQTPIHSIRRYFT